MISIRKSLSSELSLGILLLAVPIFVLSLGILFVQSRNQVKQEALEHANSVLNTTLQRVNRHFMAVETATNANSWYVNLHLQPDSVLSLTRRIVQFNPHVDGCSVSMEPNVFPEYGRYFSAYTIRKNDSLVTVVEEEYEYFQKAWYNSPLKHGNACWVNYYDETDSLEVALTGMIASFSKPIYRPSTTPGKKGELIAVISTDLSLRHLSEVITAEKPYPNSYFIMIDKDGYYYIHPDSAMLFHQTIFNGADPRHQADIITLGHEMTAGNHGNMGVVIDDASCLVCYRPLTGTPWSLAFICPESDVLRGYHKLTYIVIPLLIIGLFAILLFSRRTVAHAIAPIGKLLEQTQIIASGNYEVHIPRSQRKDAVGRLQNSFATMLQSLNFHMGSVRYTADVAKRKNEELVQATRLVEEANRQKTTFLQNLSHQIRTPLNIVMGFAQVLRDTSALAGEDTKSITDTMKRNATLLNRLVLMLFDSSDIGLSEELNSLQQDMVPCNELAHEVIDSIKQKYQTVNVCLKTELPDDFCIQTNRTYLKRCLRELLYNSAKHSDGQHTVLRMDMTDSSVRFIVEDTGKGISEADRDHIFKFFTKVDDLSEGLGLGLPLAKRHAQNLGGDLTLDTNYHDGCRFIVVLPILH